MLKKIALFSNLILASTGALATGIDVVKFKEANQLPVQEKKEFFFESVYQMVVDANKQVKKEREEIKSSTNLAQYCVKYRVKECSQENLLKKVNVIPPSLALAQAANESAWGTSRFAQKANNLFGEWCFSEGCGLVPLSRPDGETYEVEKFNKLRGSVASYIHNLNSHPAYKKLRDIRNSVGVNGYEMAEGLEAYSARGKKYVEELQSMIEYNGLQEYDEKFKDKI